MVLSEKEIQLAPTVKTEEKPISGTEKDPAAEASESFAGDVVKEKPIYDFFKRVFDIVCSFLGLIAFSPLFLVFSVMIKAERSGGKVFYKQKRLGRYGREIYIYKFRSMYDGADDVEKWLDKKQLEQYYCEYKVENDPRVTKVGKFLRRTGLDELPQLVNILKGELSLVGPRPIQRAEIGLYGEKNKETLLSVKPGLTGYWQTYCTDDTNYANQKRQSMELYYVKNRNALWDLKICFVTVGAIFKKFKRGQ